MGKTTESVRRRVLGAREAGGSTRHVLDGDAERRLDVPRPDEHVLARALVGEVSAVERHVVRVAVRRADALALRRPDVRPPSRLALAANAAAVVVYCWAHSMRP